MIDLNTATIADLKTLPNIGPVVAARIVVYRHKRGAFPKIEELMNVRGVSEAVFLALKPLVKVANTVTHNRYLVTDATGDERWFDEQGDAFEYSEWLNDDETTVHEVTIESREVKRTLVSEGVTA